MTFKLPKSNSMESMLIVFDLQHDNESAVQSIYKNLNDTNATLLKGRVFAVIQLFAVES